MKSNQKSPGLTRRDFARGAALAATAAVVPLVACATAGSRNTNPEVEAMYNAILRQHGSILSDEQKKELHAQLDSTVQGLAKLRAFPLENWNEPATVLHLAPPSDKVSVSAKGGK